MSIDALNSIRALAGIDNLNKNYRMVDRSKPLTLCANFSWTAFGSVFYNCCQFCLFIALVKLGSTEMAGQYTIGLAVTAPVMIFFGSNLRAIIVSDVHRECQIGGYLAFRLISLTMALSMIFAIVLMSGYRYETALVVIMVALAKSIEGISAIFFGYFQQNERMDQIAISRIAKGILSILFFVAGVWIFGTVLGGVGGLAVAWLTTLLFFDIPRAHILANHRVAHQNARMERFWPVWNARQLKKLLMLSLPIGITVMLVSLSANIPRYFVSVWEGESALGIFGPISYFMVLGNEIVMALGQSAAPRMARYYALGDRTAAISLLLREKAVGAVLGVFGVAVAATAGPWLLSIGFGPEYAKYGHVFLLLAMTSGTTLVFGFSWMLLTAARAFWIQIPLRVCSLTTMAVCCMVLVPSHGIEGAATAMLISTLIHSTLALTAAVVLLYRMQNTGEITLRNNGQRNITPYNASEPHHPGKASEEGVLELGA